MWKLNKIKALDSLKEGLTSEKIRRKIRSQKRQAMEKIKLLEFLKEKNQTHLTKYLSSLSEDEIKTLQEDHFIFDLPKEKIYDQSKIAPISPEYIDSPTPLKNSDKVHVVILAAGQGTRLGIGPKALLSFHETSLLGYHLKALSQLKLPLMIHILLSKKQGSLIEHHLQENNYFEHPKENISFSYQKDAFFLNSDLQLCFESPQELAKGPAGNGEVFLAMKDQLASLRENEFVFILPIDNPLGINALPSLLSSMKQRNSDLSLAVFEKKNRDESLGVIIEYDHTPMIIDYPFIPKQLSLGTKSLLANTNLFCLRGNLFHLLSEQQLPFHMVVKQVDVYEKGYITKESLYRFERFITDIVPFSKKPSFVVFERDQIYSAIKDQNSYKSTLSFLNFS